jgi:hypothetical protein
MSGRAHSRLLPLGRSLLRRVRDSYLATGAIAFTLFALQPSAVYAQSTGLKKSRTGVAVSIAAQAPFGKTTGAPSDAAREVLGNELRLGVGIRYALSQRVRLELDLGAQAGSPGSAMRRLCAFTDSSCLLLGTSLAFEGALSLTRARTYEVWIRNGIGAELVLSGSLAYPAAILFGWEWFRPAVGIDFGKTPTSKKFGVFLQGSFGTYVSALTTNTINADSFASIRDLGIHGRIGLGLRVVLQ